MPMKFCTKCGHELKENHKVCPKCGNRVQIEENTLNEFEFKEENILEHKIEVEEVDGKAVQKKGISKVKIIIACAVAVVFILVGVLSYVYIRLSDPVNTVEAFKKAVNERDTSKIKNLVECSDSSVKIDDDSAKVIIKYFNKNDNYFDSTISELDSEANNIKHNSYSLTEKSYVYTIEKKENKFLVLPSYKIVVKPSYITVKTKIKGTDIYINNKKVGTSSSNNSSKKYGPYVAGEYEVKGNYKGKYADSKETKTVNTVKADKNKVDVTILKNLTYVKIVSDNQDGEVFINDKDTGKKVKDIDTIGPIDDKCKIYGVIKKDGKTIKSKVEDGKYYMGLTKPEVDLEFFNSEYPIGSNERKVASMIRMYISSFCEAVNKNNFSFVQEYLYPDSDLYKQQVAYIPDAYNKKIIEVELRCDIISCTFNPDGKTGTVITHEVYDIDNNGKDDGKKEFDYKYTFKYNDATSTYQLTNIENAK
ncbi:hypothetical protein CLAUR_034060 [Clostridium felsineum]|nr:hypothetical protein CLAUR_034060 [Clostridium felsineum]